jgi:hypothetical protein
MQNNLQSMLTEERYNLIFVPLFTVREPKIRDILKGPNWLEGVNSLN